MYNIGFDNIIFPFIITSVYVRANHSTYDCVTLRPSPLGYITLEEDSIHYTTNHEAILKDMILATTNYEDENYLTDNYYLSLLKRHNRLVDYIKKREQI